MSIREEIVLSIVKAGLRYEWANECVDTILSLIDQQFDELARERGYVKIETGDIYWTRKQREAPDPAKGYYMESKANSRKIKEK